ncbi:MAG: hypothetical protein MJZ04_00280 [Bacteroidales bacterium]|nr:hypothetical protein [Bacteroidales bacterium]
MKKKDNILVGLVDADMMAKGTRHPNLVLLKLAGYFKERNISYKLITDDHEDIAPYYRIYISKVFTFTPEPSFYSENKKDDKFRIGGTGWYATEEDASVFQERREIDFHQLEKDDFLVGLDMRRQMPEYDLYKEYVESLIAEGHKRIHYKDYLDYSIGFLTRGCFRQCPFCVNRLEKKVCEYSSLEDFYDERRPYIYLWDDNFFALGKARRTALLQELINTGRPFQFRQGLDERLLDEDLSRMLSKAKYHGDMIFAFDNWPDRDIIQNKIKIWRKYNPTKPTKFYLFCGFHINESSDERLLQDVREIFWRIRILMKYGCMGYVMRHEDYKKHPLSNIYVQIARWCNQPQFYKKMSFHEFVDRNQYYVKTEGKKCMTLRTYEDFLLKFSDYREELEDLFDNVKYSLLYNPKNWEE